MTITSKQRRTKARVGRRKDAADKRRLAAVAKAEQDERRAEAIAPAAQRNAVLGRNGEVLRGPRLEVRNGTVIKSNPVRRMRLMNKHKDQPLVTKRHEDAADRLLSAWEIAQTISAGVGSYGERTGGVPSTGSIADAVLEMTNAQMGARREVEMVRTYLGGLWNAAYAIIILGIDVGAWGEQQDMSASVSSGYVAAMLDRLVEIYAPKQDKPQRIRSAEIRGVVIEEITDQA